MSVYGGLVPLGLALTRSHSKWAFILIRIIAPENTKCNGFFGIFPGEYAPCGKETAPPRRGLKPSPGERVAARRADGCGANQLVLFVNLPINVPCCPTPVKNQRFLPAPPGRSLCGRVKTLPYGWVRSPKALSWGEGGRAQARSGVGRYCVPPQSACSADSPSREGPLREGQDPPLRVGGDGGLTFGWDCHASLRTGSQ